MKKLILASIILALGTLVLPAADPLDAELQARIDAKSRIIENWAANPVVVNAVKEQNANPPASYAAFTQEKWKTLSVLDPVVRAFTKNPAAEFLKSQKTDPCLSEAFLSASNGGKVAFLSKPSNWSHKGSAKHEDPMHGKKWQGPVEVDESSGVKQVQISVPVLDGGKPIGSLTVGLNVSKLTEK